MCTHAKDATTHTHTQADQGLGHQPAVDASQVRRDRFNTVYGCHCSRMVRVLKGRMGECYELSFAITISSVEPLRTGANGHGPGQHRGPQVEPGGLWNSFWSSFRRSSGKPRLLLPGVASTEYECQPFLTLRVM